MKKLVEEIRRCSLCAHQLELGPRPVLSVSRHCKIVIIGQAPGLVVHRSGIPWDDKSGDNLRKWMGLHKENFYNSEIVALLPMGFCYPGKGKSGDLAPRPECAPKWHSRILSKMKEVELTLLIGKYAQEYYLKGRMEKNLTNTVKNYATYLPQYFVLPHPSPRNNIWQVKNPWFKRDILPELKKRVQKVMK